MLPSQVLMCTNIYIYVYVCVYVCFFYVYMIYTYHIYVQISMYACVYVYMHGVHIWSLASFTLQPVSVTTCNPFATKSWQPPHDQSQQRMVRKQCWQSVSNQLVTGRLWGGPIWSKRGYRFCTKFFLRSFWSQGSHRPFSESHDRSVTSRHFHRKVVARWSPVFGRKP